MTAPHTKVYNLLAGLAAITITAALGACTPQIRVNFPPGGTATAEPRPTAITAPGALPQVTVVETIAAAPSPTPSPTPAAAAAAATQVAQPAQATTAAGAGKCPAVKAGAAAPPKPATVTDTAQVLLSFLNDGATDTALLSALQSWDEVYLPAGSRDPLGAVVTAQLEPGNTRQTIVVYYDPADRQAATRHGDLVVYQCSGGKVHITYQASADPAFGGEVTNPRVLSTDDVTGDGIGDLAYLVGNCGDNTCFDGISIMTADRAAVTDSKPTSDTVDGMLVNAISDFSVQPYPTFRFVPAEQGGAKDLVVVPGYLGSADAGPQRTFTDTWSFVSGAYSLTQELKEPPVYRIHALQDGDDAFRMGDYAAADASYHRVVDDPSLQPWDGNPNPDGEQQLLAAFATVRLMQAAAVSGDAAGVKTAHDALATLAKAVPAGSPGALYAQMGEVFYKAYDGSKDYPQACDATVSYAKQHPDTYTTLGQQTYGYSNYDYVADDMCIVPDR